MRILIIDDSVEYVALLTRLIKAIHSDAQIEHYDLEKNHLPIVHPDIEDLDLIFLDYHLSPVLNGLEVLKDLRDDGCDVPVIMLTGEDSSRIAVESLKAGAIDYVSKSEVSKDVIAEKILDAFDFSSRKESLANAFHEKSSTPSLSTAGLSISNEVLFETEKSTSGNTIEVPGYEILREIGQGGMSTVFLARRMEDNRKIVLKVMFTEGREDPQALKRFMQEYTLISCLDHPNVIRIYERAFGFNFAYIAMEYFPDGDLSTRIDEGLPPAVCINYLIQIIKGLNAVHELDVVHRDLKPGNILFKDDNNLTITDFGAAKSIRTEPQDLTMDNVIVGTPYYMSPEQATGRFVDERSDIYSLGVILFQMLTGDRPFKAKTISELIRLHVSAPIPKLAGKLIRYQPLIDGLLAKDPDERFQSANDILLALDWV